MSNDFSRLYKMLDDQEPCSFLIDCINENKIMYAIEYIEKYCNCDKDMANQLYIEFKKWYDETFLPSPDLTPQEIAHNNQIAQDWSNKPKCITCGSTNIKKISTSAKVAGAVAFGLFSKTAKSQFKCENCGCKW